MQLPQKKQETPGAENRLQPEGATPSGASGISLAVAATESQNTVVTMAAGIGGPPPRVEAQASAAPAKSAAESPLASPLAPALGLAFGSQFSRPDVSAPLPAMPGSERMAGEPSADADNPERQATPDAALRNLATLVNDLAPDAEA